MTSQKDDDGTKSMASGLDEEEDDDGGVVAEAFVQLGSYHSSRHMRLVVDEQNTDDKRSSNDAGEDAA
jgi:hypothetical protein